MEECKVCNLYNLEETIAKELFEGVTYPWEVLGRIHDFIIELGQFPCPKNSLREREKTFGWQSPQA